MSTYFGMYELGEITHPQVGLVGELVDEAGDAEDVRRLGSPSGRDTIKGFKTGGSDDGVT